MSIPGKVLVALLSALTVSLLSTMLMPSVPFLQILWPTATAACAAVILSHRAVPMPAGLAPASPDDADPRPDSGTKKKVRKAEGRSAGTTGKSGGNGKSRSRNSGGNTGGAGTKESGTVKWFNSTKGFGFIVRGNGEEIFVHHRNIRGEGRRSLRDGASVRFSVVDTEKGPQAEDVEAVD